MVHRGRRAWRIIGLLDHFLDLGSRKYGSGRHRMQRCIGRARWIVVHAIIWKIDVVLEKHAVALEVRREQKWRIHGHVQ